jgi:gluconolactonase
VSLFDGARLDTVSEGPGSPNSVTLGSDGYLYAAQNGGVERSWGTSQTTPSIEKISFGGSIEAIATSVAGIELQAPNDLVFGPDGRLYFTDPGEAWNFENPQAVNRLFAIGESSGEVLIELPPSYVNGLAFAPDGRLVWVESYRRDVCILEANRRVLCRLPELHSPDGLDVALDGRLFIATVTSHGITIVSPEGEVLSHIFLDENALSTNCCFQGSDLWVTDFGVGFKPGNARGRLWRVPTDAVGKPQTPGAIRRP